MKLKRGEVFEIWDVINKNLSGDYNTNKMFVYSVTKIKTCLKTEYDAILRAGQPSQQYVMFEEERRGIIDVFSEKDGDGSPVAINGNYKIIEGKEVDAQKALKDTFEKYKDAVDKRFQEVKEFNTFLETNVEIDVDLIPLEFVPDSITQEIMQVLLPVIEG